MPNTAPDKKEVRGANTHLREPLIRAHWYVITQIYVWIDLGEKNNRTVRQGFLRIQKAKTINKLERLDFITFVFKRYS